MLDKVKDGWMQSSLLIAIVSSPARHDHGLARDPRAPPISESTKISFAELNLRLQKEEEGKCKMQRCVVGFSIFMQQFCSKLSFCTRLALKKSEEGGELYSRP